VRISLGITLSLTTGEIFRGWQIRAGVSNEVSMQVPTDIAPLTLNVGDALTQANRSKISDLFLG
jgi:hypothetical protein